MITLTIPDTVSGFTVENLKDLPDKLRWELHNGRLVIISSSRLWHQEIEARIRNLLQADGRFAATEVGVINTPGDTRVPDVAAFATEPEDWDTTWHQPATLTLVVEVWSPGSDDKDRDTRWYAERGIPEYWFAEPTPTDKRNAMITMYRLERHGDDCPTYVATGRTALADLERDGLPRT